MKLYKLISVISLILPAFFTYGKTVVTVCTNCTQLHALEALKASAVVGDKVYVLDAKNKLLKKYKIKVRPDGDAMERYASQLSVSSQEQSLAQDFFEDRNTLHDQMIARPFNFQNTFINASVTQFSAPTIEGLNTFSVGLLSSTSSDCSPSPDHANVYDFIQSSQIRTNTYENMKLWYPALQNAIDSWNNFFQHAQVDAKAGTIDGEWLTIEQQINFLNGGKVSVVTDPSGNTFSVVKGSAFDCSGNQIPTEQASFQGRFSFDSARELQEFQNYGDSWGVEFVFGNICRDSFQAVCKRTSSNKYSCNYTTVCF